MKFHCQIYFFLIFESLRNLNFQFHPKINAQREKEKKKKNIKRRSNLINFKKYTRDLKCQFQKKFQVS